MSCAHISEAGVEPLTAEDRGRYERWNREPGGAALRVLGLAYRELPENYSGADLARDFVFVALVGRFDPLRDWVKDAITTCRQAGIRTLMITGDQPPTAAEIGRQLWLNMVTDVFPALALALVPSAPDMTKRPPRDSREGLVNRQFLGLVAWQGAMLAALTLWSWSSSRGVYAFGSSQH